MKLEPVLEVVFSPSFCIEKQELEREREIVVKSQRSAQ